MSTNILREQQQPDYCHVKIKTRFCTRMEVSALDETPLAWNHQVWH